MKYEYHNLYSAHHHNLRSAVGSNLLLGSFTKLTTVSANIKIGVTQQVLNVFLTNRKKKLDQKR